MVFLGDFVFFCVSVEKKWNLQKHCLSYVGDFSIVLSFSEGLLRELCMLHL